MGAVANMAPEKFRRIIKGRWCPFVDVLQPLLDDTLPLTPGVAGMGKSHPVGSRLPPPIAAYCPLLTTSLAQGLPALSWRWPVLNDLRCSYWERPKWGRGVRER